MAGAPFLRICNYELHIVYDLIMRFSSRFVWSFENVSTDTWSQTSSNDGVVLLGHNSAVTKKARSEPSKETSNNNNVALSNFFAHFYVNGEILTYKKSALCADPTSKLANNGLYDNAWLNEHRFQKRIAKHVFSLSSQHLQTICMWEYT